MGKNVIWSDRAQVQLRAIDRTTALRILRGLARVMIEAESEEQMRRHTDAIAEAIQQAIGE